MRVGVYVCVAICELMRVHIKGQHLCEHKCQKETVIAKYNGEHVHYLKKENEL